MIDKSPRAKITVEFGNADERCPEWPASQLEEVAFSAKPLDLEFEEQSGRSGRLGLAMSRNSKADGSALLSHRGRLY